MIKANVKILIVSLVVLLVILFGAFSKKLGLVHDGYSIVYLSTGEVYIGKLSISPCLTLKDSYILQVTPDAVDPSKNNFNLQPVKDALWAPTKLHLVKDNIVFYGPLSPESPIAKVLAEQTQQ